MTYTGNDKRVRYLEEAQVLSECLCIAVQNHFHSFLVFSFIDTPTTEIYTLSLHDALPIYFNFDSWRANVGKNLWLPSFIYSEEDRKSTRLNSSHVAISYAVFCLKKKMLR